MLLQLPLKPGALCSGPRSARGASLRRRDEARGTRVLARLSPSLTLKRKAKRKARPSYRQDELLNNEMCDVGTTGQKSISRIIDYLEHC